MKKIQSVKVQNSLRTLLGNVPQEDRLAELYKFCCLECGGMEVPCSCLADTEDKAYENAIRYGSEWTMDANYMDAENELGGGNYLAAFDDDF